MTYVVMVTASRGWRFRRMVDRVLTQIEDELPGRDFKLIHGGANGGDKIAEYAARRLGWEIEEFPADWEKYKKKAGVIRSFKMLDERPDLVVAFWDGSSKGTYAAFNEALKRGIPTDVYVRRGR